MAWFTYKEGLTKRYAGRWFRCAPNRNLFDTLAGKHKFIWVTDGCGWKTTARPLRETFNHNEYLFSLDMLEKEILGYLTV